MTLETLQDIIGMIWQLALALSIIGGAAIAAWRLNIFRYVQPSATIELEVHSCESAPSWNAITIIAKITNTSRVKITIREMNWVVRSLGPYTDDWIAEQAQLALHRCRSKCRFSRSRGPEFVGSMRSLRASISNREKHTPMLSVSRSPLAAQLSMFSSGFAG